MINMIIIAVQVYCAQPENYKWYQVYKTDTPGLQMSKCEKAWFTCFKKRGVEYCLNAQQNGVVL